MAGPFAHFAVVESVSYALNAHVQGFRHVDSVVLLLHVLLVLHNVLQLLSVLFLEVFLFRLGLLLLLLYLFYSFQKFPVQGARRIGRLRVWLLVVLPLPVEQSHSEILIRRAVCSILFVMIVWTIGLFAHSKATAVGKLFLSLRSWEV